jgi:hypothetical protein
MNEPPIALNIGDEKRCTAINDSDSKLLFQHMDANCIEIYAPEGTAV